jgi:hypothetical protein
MGMSDGRSDVEKEADAAVNTELVMIAVLVNWFAFDMLENQIGLASFVDACINEFGDVRMSKLAENAPLALETFDATACGDRKMQELDRYEPLEAAIASLRQPDASHASLPEWRNQSVRADDLPGERRFRRQKRLPLKKVRFRDNPLRMKKSFQKRRDFRLICAQ